MKYSVWINGFEWVETPYPFKGKIPPIAEKEKRGKPVKRQKEEPYVRELESKRSVNLPAANR